MYLINAKTYNLEYFMGSAVPRYAILSHTWGKEEVTFKDMTEGPLETAKKGNGYNKIVNTCLRAVSDGLEYAWVDTWMPLSSCGNVLPVRTY